MRRVVILSLLAAVLVAALATAAQARGTVSGAIAFVRDGDIWTIAADGGGAQQLTTGGSEDAAPTWSPDRQTIAFVRSPGGWAGPPRIYLLAAAGGALSLLKYKDALPATTYRTVTALSYSPDGAKLAFSDSYAIKGGVYTNNRVVVINLRTRTTAILVHRARGLDTSWTLSWSPNGKTILVGQIGQSEEGAEAWRLDVARKRLSKLGIAYAAKAAWSGDGKSVTVSTENQKRSRILLATAGGKVVRTLASGGSWFTMSDANPVVGGACFSRDGQQIVYVTRSSATEPSLWIMNIDGSGKHRLTAGEAPAGR